MEPGLILELMLGWRALLLAFSMIFTMLLISPIKQLIDKNGTSIGSNPRAATLIRAMLIVLSMVAMKYSARE